MLSGRCRREMRTIPLAGLGSRRSSPVDSSLLAERNKPRPPHADAIDAEASGNAGSGNTPSKTRTILTTTSTISIGIRSSMDTRNPRPSGLILRFTVGSNEACTLPTGVEEHKCRRGSAESPRRASNRDRSALLVGERGIAACYVGSAVRTNCRRVLCPMPNYSHYRVQRRKCFFTLKTKYNLNRSAQRTLLG